MPLILFNMKRKKKEILNHKVPEIFYIYTMLKKILFNSFFVI